MNKKVEEPLERRKQGRAKMPDGDDRHPKSLPNALDASVEVLCRLAKDGKTKGLLTNSGADHGLDVLVSVFTAVEKHLAEHSGLDLLEEMAKSLGKPAIGAQLFAINLDDLLQNN